MNWKYSFKKVAVTIKNYFDKIPLPGSGGEITLYHLFYHFQQSIADGKLTTRAASVSFKFFLALFPGILFLFTIIPLIPIANFYPTLMLTMKDIIPEKLFPLAEQTIADIVGRKQTGLLSVGFIMAFYFSSSSFISIISSFNQSVNITETRSGFEKRVISIVLMIASTIMMIVAIALMTLGQDTMIWLTENGFIRFQGSFSLFHFFRWSLLAFVIYLTISMIYYIAPAKRIGFRFFSFGSLLSTLFLMANAWGFGFFIKYFSAHNALYGSVGTLLLLLLYIYYNAIVLLVGFELNASFLAAKKSPLGHRKIFRK